MYKLIETTGFCDAHLINEGVVIEDGVVTIMLQVTGPSRENRLSDPQFECRVDSSNFFNCKLGDKCKHHIVSRS